MNQLEAASHLNFFKPALALSVLAHAAFFVPVYLSAPSVSVEPGISSLSLVLEEQAAPEKSKPAETPKDVPSVTDFSEDPVMIKSLNPKDKKAETKKGVKESRRIVAVASDGAIQEAHPDMPQNKAPEYPREAREKGWEGLVVLKVHVQNNGKVSLVEVERSSGHLVLDESGVKAVRSWRFLPSRIGPMAFDSWIRVPLQFVLQDEAQKS